VKESIEIRADDIMIPFGIEFFQGGGESESLHRESEKGSKGKRGRGTIERQFGVFVLGSLFYCCEGGCNG